jgi:hypothetical protein
MRGAGPMWHVAQSSRVWQVEQRAPVAIVP